MTSRTGNDRLKATKGQGLPKRPPQKGKETKEYAGEFHNPYNFIPSLPRDEKDAELGDKIPVGHDCYYTHYWSGKIVCKLTTITPLLIPDAAKAKTDGNEHKTYPLRMVDGKPYLPPTSLKGMLRNAYEAVTNSRFGVFAEHGDRLAYRMNAKKVDVVPARVEENKGKLLLRVMAETEAIGYAGKLPCYSRKVKSKERENFSLKYEGTRESPSHGDRVWVRLNREGKNPIEKSAIATIGKEKPKGDGDWREGWVYISNENINGKKYERVFLPREDDWLIPVTPAHQRMWRELIKNYQETHEKDLQERRDRGIDYDFYEGDEPGRTAWSRHIYEPGAEELREGTFCYIEFDNNEEIEALLPVILSRRLYEKSPRELLDPSLHPADKISKLSPADRVFGWVNQQGDGAYKGQLRVREINYDSCLGESPIAEFPDPGVPLAILGEPKPQQGRFYLAKNQEGEPLEPQSAKQEAYQTNKHLRGRKVYPHHQKTGENGVWKNPEEDRTQKEGSRQEYRRPQKAGSEQRDRQNRSITAWVNPGVNFTVTIDVVNLSSVELGALLWLLDLGKDLQSKDIFHRLGGGKPFGFGSVKLEIAETELLQGQEWKEFYGSLFSSADPGENPAETVETFKEKVRELYQKPFGEVPFIAAFLQGAKGFDDGLPIHYPRKDKTPKADGENFKWFVENERYSQLSLPILVEDRGLPYFK